MTMWLQRVPGGAVEHVAYTTDGKMLYTADTSGVYTAWDTRTKSGTRMVRISASIMRPVGMFPAAKSRFLVINGTPPVIWDVRAGEDWGRVPVTLATPLDLKPVPQNDSMLLYIAESRRALHTFDAVAKKPGPVHDGWTRTAPLASFDIAPDGRTTALLDRFGLILLFDLTDASEIARWTVASGTERVRFSSDGKTLIVFQGKQLSLWDVETQKERVAGVKFQPPGFATHPFKSVFAAVSPDRVMAFWSLDTGEQYRALDFALGRYAQCVAFSPDGTHCAVGGNNKQFIVFDVDPSPSGIRISPITK
jgi:WD40 repeat protein